MKMNRTLIAMVIVGASYVGPLSAQDKKDAWTVPEEVKKLKNPVPATKAGLDVAREIYADKCAKCHGDTGKGDGAEAAMYSVKVSDFTDARARKAMTDGEIFYKLTEGRRPMPSFKKRLTDEQRWQLVNFIRTFAVKSANPGKKSETHP